MRVLVTGPGNAFGMQVCEALSKAGHQVRAFGLPAGTNPFAHLANVEIYPGVVEIGGSIEPVACECQAIVHCSNLDAPAKDATAQAHAVHIERGSLYVRYAAERELVRVLVNVAPWSPGAKWSLALREATKHIEGSRVPHVTVRADPANAIDALGQIVRYVEGITPIQHQDTASPADKPVPSPTA